MSHYYDQIASGYDRLHKLEQLEKMAVVAEHIRVKPGDKVLDVGSGTGFCLDNISCFKVGIDPSFEMLKKSPHNKIQAKGEALPFKDSSFDLVISMTAVQNFDDINKGLKEMKRVGKDRFIISVLKRSEKLGFISNLIHFHFNVRDEVEEEKDIIFVV